MILFVGQIDRAHRDREAFQEVDYRAMFGPVATWVAEIDRIDRLPEYISRAFHVAMSGRPGPVVLALPEDMLSARAAVADIPARAPVLSPVSSAQIDAVTTALSQARRPLLMVGGTLWDHQVAQDLTSFASAWNLPVAVPFRRQCHLDNRHPTYAGDRGIGMNSKLGARLKDADCLVMIGGRQGDSMTCGYELMNPADPGKPLSMSIPMHQSWAAYTAPMSGSWPLQRKSRPPFRRLCRTPSSGMTGPPPRAQITTPGSPRGRTPAASRWNRSSVRCRTTCPRSPILTNGVGNYAAFLHRYFVYKQHFTQLAPTSGSMGYGFPAAVSAAIEHPDRTVVCLAGDGCFQTTLNEMSTAVQYGAAPIVIVANNGQYGTIRMHQERHYPGRVSGTALTNPDFAALARAYGGLGEIVHDTADFPAAFAPARASGTLAVIELRLDPEALSSGATLSQIRTQGEQAQR